jgi:hypothetical protein
MVVIAAVSRCPTTLGTEAAGFAMDGETDGELGDGVALGDGVSLAGARGTVFSPGDAATPMPQHTSSRRMTTPPTMLAVLWRRNQFCSWIQKFHPSGAGPHSGSGCHPSGGVHPAGGVGQFGGEL